MRLYEIEHELRKCLEFVDPETGALDEAAAFRIQELETKREEKSLGIAKFIRELDAEATAVKSEETRLRDRRRSIEGRAAWLRGYLEANIKDHLEPGQSLGDGSVRLSWRKSQQVQVTAIDEIPETFVRVKREPDKTLLRAALIEGNVPGAILVTKQNLQIR